eukprot:CAMPEP_0194395472 /NCGR_PEP_ID=MMETSP0174-20130528/124443_1 /TAXON_ID=216777 /ORGANISM="Proboscia alata, Strain PI-D3" /LENGTH=646 /DNA_ID=CAMNT_0039191415 /DNA_START=903 /DNA_END=2843 /DNA_ORIENTATION=-
MEIHVPNAYELERLSKIRRNQAVLVSLGLEKHSLAPKKRTNDTQSRKIKRPPQTPTRKSRRIASIPASSVYIDSELANGTLTLGGADAVAFDSVDLPVSRASDEDPAPDEEDLLFPDEKDVYELLREEKNVIARELECPAYHVAQNRALMAMARCVPTTPAELRACWGWGDAKVSAYGDRLLAVLKIFVESLLKHRADRKAYAEPPAEPSPTVVDEVPAPDDEDLAPDDEDLLFPDEKRVYELLNNEKQAIGRELKCPAYHVAKNKALMAMARRTPTTRDELLTCWGWGPSRVAHHGDRLLAVLAPFAELLQKLRAERKAATKSNPVILSTLAPVVTPIKEESADDFEVATATRRRPNEVAKKQWEKRVPHTCNQYHDDDKSFGPLPLEPSDLQPFELPAFDAMLAWKRARAKEMGYSDPCVICHNRTLCELVRRLPQNLHRLAAVWGIGGPGTKRNDMHGRLMLAALHPFRADLLAARPPTDKEETPVKTEMTPRRKRPRPHTSRNTQGSSSNASVWDEEAGEELASKAWRDQREALRLPSCDWAGRRERCALVNGCEACGRYVAIEQPFRYAALSQRVLSILASPGAYGSHAAAHAAGWRWNARPNHRQGSHAHEWWPPEATIAEGTKLPLGTVAAFDVIDGLF